MMPGTRKGPEHSEEEESMRTRGRGAFTANRVVCGIWRTQGHRQDTASKDTPRHTQGEGAGRGHAPFHHHRAAPGHPEQGLPAIPFRRRALWCPGCRGSPRPCPLARPHSSSHGTTCPGLWSQNSTLWFFTF